MEIYKLDFCTLNIHHNYILAIMNEGINVSIEKSDLIIQIAYKHFGIKNFVYITHRINSYSVDPMVYSRVAAQTKNLVGFAIVSNAPFQKTHAKYEKIFFGKDFKQFNTTEDALKWKDEILKKI